MDQEPFLTPWRRPSMGSFRALIPHKASRVSRECYLNEQVIAFLNAEGWKEIGSQTWKKVI